jgi:hypothetical protein
MSNARIVRVDPADTQTVCHIHNTVFVPQLGVSYEDSKEVYAAHGNKSLKNGDNYQMIVAGRKEDGEYTGGVQGAALASLKANGEPFEQKNARMCFGYGEFLTSKGKFQLDRYAGMGELLDDFEKQVIEAQPDDMPLGAFVFQADWREAGVLSKAGYLAMDFEWVFPRYNPDKNGVFPGEGEVYHMFIKPVGDVKEAACLTERQAIGIIRAIHDEWLWPDKTDGNRKQVAALRKEVEECGEIMKNTIYSTIEENEDYVFPLEA